MAKQLTAPLVALHKAGLAHRDVKPENYLISKGQVKLGDFGLLTQEIKPLENIGTLDYIPPEYFLGEVNTIAFDQFALGATLFNLVCGKKPKHFYAAQANKHLTQSPNFLYETAESVKQNQINPSLESISLQLMHPNPRLRLTTAQAMDLMAKL